MAKDAGWWQAPELRGELDVILGLISKARWQMRRDEEKAARKFCDALNRAWNARTRLDSDSRPNSDWPLVKALVSSLPSTEALTLLRSEELRGLAAIDPPILNHSELLGHGFLGSVADIPERVRREASAAHRKLSRRLGDLPDHPSAEQIEATLVRVADLLYAIRSNLQHGEKFASADPGRIARDRSIAEQAARVLELFFDLVFARPSMSLVAYGSLAPGGVHHRELEGVGGVWVPALIRGQLHEGRFPRLVLAPSADEIPVQMLRSAPGLPERWSRLDQLEGESYRRVLAAVESQDRELVIVNVYAG
jgi:gamma-glutamylcyclotransferase (GGCT)/AIG2-like uncharacterized protein YtfP